MNTSAAQPILEIKNLHAGYGQSEILHGLNMSVFDNEIVAIIGPNGAGKSTAMKSILGLLTISQGDILLKGEAVTNTPANQVITKGIAYVPQTDNVFVNLSVQENLEMGAWTRATGIQEKLNQMYELFPDLKQKRKQAAGSLSGGQRQMVAMGKALMIDSDVLLLDEPTAGLSPKYRAQIFTIIRDIRDSGIPIMIVEQNAKQALGSADRGYVMVDGGNRHEGTGTELIENREVARMFLGGRE